MQYHYVVLYDTDKDRWFVDPTFFPEGNIFNSNALDKDECWIVPDDGSFKEALDQKCLNMLLSLVPIWPSPLVNGEL